MNWPIIKFEDKNITQGPTYVFLLVF